MSEHSTTAQWIQKLIHRYDGIFKILSSVQQKENKQWQTLVTERYEAQLQQQATLYQQQIQQLEQQNRSLHQQLGHYQEQYQHHLQLIASVTSRYDTALVSMLQQQQPTREIHVSPTSEAPKRLALQRDESLPYPLSVYELGMAYRKQNDFESAIGQFQLAAKLNFPPAMGALARAYAVGEGVRKDHVQSLAWLMLAAERGFEPAQQKLHQQQHQPHFNQSEALKDQLLSAY